MSPIDELACPLPSPPGARIELAHGEGARWTRRLIREMLINAFHNPILSRMDDAAVLPSVEGRIVMSTDTYVVSPIFFPGGDLGKLAVHGTVNDLVSCGAEPLYLSLGLVLEEGLLLETLRRVVESIRDAAVGCGISIVTGDTKVVPRGAADGIFVNTTGIGRCRSGCELGWERIEPGDGIIVTGRIADHGIAILGAREGFDFGGQIKSDTAALHRVVARVLDAEIDVHFLRDPTRGGISAVLHELAEQTGHSLLIEERRVPVAPEVRGACELLGLDPLYVANEGKMLLFVPASQVDQALALLREDPLSRDATQIGEVSNERTGRVLIRGPLGRLRILDEPSGAPLPRIC